MSELKFEHALEKLEKIVAEMESGQLTLENSLKKYEEGIKLSRFCTQKLKEAEKKIEILIRKKDGELEAEPFAETEQAETKKNEETDEEDFLF